MKLIVVLIFLIIILLYFLKQKEKFKTNDYKIIIFFTGGLCEEAKNCIQSIDNVGLKNKLIVHTLDKESFNCVKESNIEIKRVKTNLKSKADSGSKDFYEIVQNKFKIIRKCLLDYNKIIVYSDTDIVFLKDISNDIETFRKSKYDIMIQDDSESFNKSKNLCTGFILFKSNKTNIKFIDGIIEEMKQNFKKIKQTNNGLADQKHFNKQLKKNKINIGILDLKEFTNGARYFGEDYNGRKLHDSNVYKTFIPKIVHNNFIVGTQEKKERFKKHNLWFINSINSNNIEQFTVKKRIHIIQHGTDGVGHQLHGLFSLLALHNINNFYFDGYAYINKQFSFEHQTKKEDISNIQKYMIEIVQQYLKDNKQIKKKQYNNRIHSHELFDIPKNYDTNTLYSIDNCYYFDKIKFNNPKEYNQYLVNIKNISKYFINDKLPTKRLDKNNIVIHVRLGDALATTSRGDHIKLHSKKLIQIIPILINKYKNYTFYIHSAGDVSFLTSILLKQNIKFLLFKKNEKTLNIISDFIYSKVFITSYSSLSTVCTFLGNHKLIIVPDELKHSLPKKVIRISNFINSPSIKMY